MTHSTSIEQLSGEDPNKVIRFPLGILGFEKYTNYIVYHKQENSLSAYWLESCDQPVVTFTLVDPLQYGLNYEFQLTPEELEMLGAADVNEIAVFMMLVKADHGEAGAAKLHANIRGPVLINPKTRCGLQKVLQGFKSDIIE